MGDGKNFYALVSDPKKATKIALFGLVAVVLIFYISSSYTYKNPNVN